MRRVYHHHELWEDYINGMWRKESKEYEETMLHEVVEFTGNAMKYGTAMLRVVNEWPVSCEHNLTNVSLNRKAWIGHAACCLEKNYPEYLVRQAWGMLTEQQRVDANAFAVYAIRKWESEYNLSKNNITQFSLF